MFTSSANRVSQNTADSVNECIRRQTEERVARTVEAGQAAIDDRLAQLDQEWDIERCLETMAPSLTLAGIALGLTVNRKWFTLPVLIQSFFLQHALQGWCPPIPVLRRLGVRTTGEIDEERNALKAVRGDYLGMAEQDRRTAQRAFEAARI